ncbi:MAG TPA: class I SAM-dependent methyltransferase [Polyangiaceae bacterium]|nr:class I SAM-dependent methyltransferase [Polyangiaceae bacterium]
MSGPAGGGEGQGPGAVEPAAVEPAAVEPAAVEPAAGEPPANGPATGEGGVSSSPPPDSPPDPPPSPRGLCPPLLAEQIVYEDDDLLVVERPAGVSSGGPDADDLVARVSAFLEAREGRAPAPVLAPWREGPEGASLVPLARSEPMRQALLKARRAWQPPRDGDRSGEPGPGPRPGNRLPGGQDGSREGASGRRGPSQEGASGRRGPSQGGSKAPPPELGPGPLAAPHPRTGRPLRLRAASARREPPGSVEGWRARLARAGLARYGLDRGGETTTFRLANEAADGLPRGAAVDLYGPYAVVHVYDAAGQAPYLGPLAEALEALGARGVYAKHHPRSASTLADPTRDDVAPARPLRGEAAPDPLWVREAGLVLLCRLGAGLATGLYLDQRDNRARVRAAAAGRSVLNLFAYTGAFSVAAAAGGARRTVTVDVSRPALAWAAENLRANGFGDERTHRLVRDDALVFLRRAAVRGDRFDLLVVDPPSFATTKASRFVAEHDLGSLLASALAVAAPGALVLACTNHRATGRARFRHVLDDAAARAGRRLERVRDLDPPRDFPAAPGEEPRLKALWALVGA